jgi:hypothetical protein
MEYGSRLGRDTYWLLPCQKPQRRRGWSRMRNALFFVYMIENGLNVSKRKNRKEQMSTRTCAPINGVKERKATWAKEREWVSCAERKVTSEGAKRRTFAVDIKENPRVVAIPRLGRLPGFISTYGSPLIRSARAACFISCTAKRSQAVFRTDLQFDCSASRVGCRVHRYA